MVLFFKPPPHSDKNNRIFSLFELIFYVQSIELINGAELFDAKNTNVKTLMFINFLRLKIKTTGNKKKIIDNRKRLWALSVIIGNIGE